MRIARPTEDVQWFWDRPSKANARRTNQRDAMCEYELLEADAKIDVSKLLNRRIKQGWNFVSLHVTERSNGSPRYTLVVAKDGARN